MTYLKLDSTGAEISRKEVDRSTLTSECWSIQFDGLEACTTCGYVGTPECGGVRIRARLLKEAKA